VKADGNSKVEPRPWQTCLGMAGFLVALIVVPVWGKGQWGAEVWRWAGNYWPGGAYSLAVIAGLAIPWLAVFLLFGVVRLSTEWTRHRLRALSWVLIAIGCLSVLELLGGAALEAVGSGSGWRGAQGGVVISGATETSKSYPRLWLAGFGATVVGITVTVVSFRVFGKPPSTRRVTKRANTGVS
jgi:hypothetical protein